MKLEKWSAHRSLDLSQGKIICRHISWNFSFQSLLLHFPPLPLPSSTTPLFSLLPNSPPPSPLLLLAFYPSRFKTFELFQLAINYFMFKTFSFGRENFFYSPYRKWNFPMTRSICLAVGLLVGLFPYPVVISRWLTIHEYYFY